MTDKHPLVTSDATRRRLEAVAPLATLFVIGGVIFSLVGWVDVGLFYYPPRFGEAEWEFGIIAQTLDAMPLPTLGLLMFAMAARASGAGIAWRRLVAALAILVMLAIIVLTIVFVLDIPVALRALDQAQQAATARGQTTNPAVRSGIKRVIAKVVIYAVGYMMAYAAIAFAMWRRPRDLTA